MSLDVIMGIVRAIMAGVGGHLISSGKLTEAELQPIVGATAVIVTIVWSVINKINHKKEVEKALLTPPPKQE